MEFNFELDWKMASCRALYIKKLSQKQIENLHKREDNRHIKNYGVAGFGWLISPNNIKKLYYNELKELQIDEKDIDTIVCLIIGQMPEDIQGCGSHSSSLEFQHAWDWNIYHNVADFNKSNKREGA